jgi:DNA-binding LacI/PurR family transcriptional regulator
VTGYDNSPVAGLAAINLTSVSQEAAELAGSAVRAAITPLEEPTQDRAETVLEPRLVPRGTTSHPRVPASREGKPTLVSGS